MLKVKPVPWYCNQIKVASDFQVQDTSSFFFFNLFNQILGPAARKAEIKLKVHCLVTATILIIPVLMVLNFLKFYWCSACMLDFESVSAVRSS